ncbi:peptidase M42 family protein [Corchorus olitorius]|uniref:Peptidase M42 family protein n=1 Tax=Corchorus olitorius TaxID=93759 RepID=A0A1R3GKY0_9ROSI|nr:peptidase M42 family protein [Corchorus olitorius]
MGKKTIKEEKRAKIAGHLLDKPGYDEATAVSLASNRNKRLDFLDKLAKPSASQTSWTDWNLEGSDEINFDDWGNKIGVSDY